MPEKIKIKSNEIKGPKVGVPRKHFRKVLPNLIMFREKDLFKKETEKGKFYFIKTEEKNILVEDLLIDILPKAISINWKKSMKWSTNDLMWGRPLRSIFAIFNGKKFFFKFHHLESTDNIIIEQDLIIKSKKLKILMNIYHFLKIIKLLLDQNERQKIILKKFNSFSKSKNYKEQYNHRLLEEVVNIVEDPNVLLVNFDKEYLKIPEEIIISTLEKHQRYFPIFDNRERLTNYFFVVANKKDEKKLLQKEIKEL